MDEMKCKIRTKFIKSIITNLIKKKLGYDLDISINDLEIKSLDNNMHLHIDTDIEISNDDFMKILKKII